MEAAGLESKVRESQCILTFRFSSNSVALANKANESPKQALHK